MGYVLVGLLVIVIVAVVLGVFWRVSNADQEGDNVSAPFSDDDHTPAGSTAEHAGEQSDSGEVATDVDADRGGTGGPISGMHNHARHTDGPTEEPEGDRYKRDPIGGEGEGSTTISSSHPRDGSA